MKKKHSWGTNHRLPVCTQIKRKITARPFTKNCIRQFWTSTPSTLSSPRLSVEALSFSKSVHLPMRDRRTSENSALKMSASSSAQIRPFVFVFWNFKLRLRCSEEFVGTRTHPEYYRWVSSAPAALRCRRHGFQAPQSSIAKGPPCQISSVLLKSLECIW